MTRHQHFASVTLLALALGLGTAGSALAQDDVDIYENEQAEPADDLSPDDLNDDELAAFLEAADSVADIRAESAEEIAEADEDQGQIIADANERMVEAIEDVGLDTETYRSIGYLFEEDEELAERLNRAAAEREAED